MTQERLFAMVDSDHVLKSLTTNVCGAAEACQKDATTDLNLMVARLWALFHLIMDRIAGLPEYQAMQVMAFVLDEECPRVVMDAFSVCDKFLLRRNDITLYEFKQSKWIQEHSRANSVSCSLGFAMIDVFLANNNFEDRIPQDSYTLINNELCDILRSQP